MDDYLTRVETENLIGKIAGTIFFALCDGQPAEVVERAKARLARAARDPELPPACRRIYAVIADFDDQELMQLGFLPPPPLQVIDGGAA